MADLEMTISTEEEVLTMEIVNENDINDNAINLVNNELTQIAKGNEAREELIDMIFELLSDEEKQKELSKNIKGLPKSEATNLIAETLLSL